MTDKEVMRLALDEIEELRYSSSTFKADKLSAAAITAMNELLSRPEQEPFGYFKAEPFGWTDCAETDEGAIALYERPGK